MACVYSIVEPTSRILLPSDLAVRLAAYCEKMALDVRQSAGYASERYMRVFGLRSGRSLLTLGATKNALESDARACLRDDTLNHAAVLHVAMIVGVTLVVRDGAADTCTVFPCYDDRRTEIRSDAASYPAVLIESDCSNNGSGSSSSCPIYRVAPERTAGPTLGHVRRFLARERGGAERLRSAKGLGKTDASNATASIADLMPLAFSLALVDGGSGVLTMQDGAERAAYHREMAKRMGGKQAVVELLRSYRA